MQLDEHGLLVEVEGWGVDCSYRRDELGYVSHGDGIREGRRTKDSSMSWVRIEVTLVQDSADTEMVDQFLASIMVFAARGMAWPDSCWSALTRCASSCRMREVASVR